MLERLQATLVNLPDLLSQLSAKFLTQAMAIELAVIIVGILVGYLARNIFAKLSRDVLDKYDVIFEEKINKYEHRLVELKAVIWPLLSGGLLWGAHQAMLSIPHPNGAVRVAAILMLAWAIIRFVSIFIASPQLSRLFEIVSWSAAALSIFGWLGPVIDGLDSLGFSLGDQRLSIWRVLKGIVLLTLFFWAAHALSKFLQNQINKTTSITASLRVLLAKVTNIGLMFLAIVLALDAVGINLTAFAVFTGALGVGIGFGLQKIISNFISGVILLLDKSLKPGDVIEVETGSGVTYGWVDKLGLRYTSVTTRDGTETLIPNETFITNPVTNWSFSHSRVRRKMPIGVAYESDVEKAMELCIEAATSVERVLDDPKPVCQLRGFGDSSVDLELRFWIGDPSGGVKNVESAVNVNIWKLFRANGIEIPFPQRDINIRTLDGEPLELVATKSTSRKTKG